MVANIKGDLPEDCQSVSYTVKFFRQRKLTKCNSEFYSLGQFGIAPNSRCVSERFNL